MLAAAHKSTWAGLRVPSPDTIQFGGRTLFTVGEAEHTGAPHCWELVMIVIDDDGEDVYSGTAAWCLGLERIFEGQQQG